MSRKSKLSEFFKLNGELVIAQRNYVFLGSEVEENKENLYRGLYQFLIDHGENLLKSLHEGSGVFGEWIGMGRIKYEEALDKRFYIFAKANLQGSYEEETLEVYNIYWKRFLLQFPFVDGIIPEYMELVPLVSTPSEITMEILDDLYKLYCEEVGRTVEGFVVRGKEEIITKYVRCKGGKLEEHRPPKK